MIYFCKHSDDALFSGNMPIVPNLNIVYKMVAVVSLVLFLAQSSDVSSAAQRIVGQRGSSSSPVS